MRHGDQLQWFLKLEEEGEKIPALENKPEIYPDLAADYLAFCQLHTTRTVGFGGPEPLKFTEIMAYMEMFGIDGYRARRYFLRRIQMIDSIYMELNKKFAPKK